MAQMKDHFAVMVDEEFEARSRKMMIEDLAKSDLEPSDLACYPLTHAPVPMVTEPNWVLAAYRIPYRSPTGELLEVMYRDRIFYKPHITERDLKDAGLGKYKQPSGHKTAPANIRGNYPYLPVGGDGPVMLICEGEKKAVAACKRFECPVIGVGGATAWRAEKGSDALHPEIINRIQAVAPKRILLCVDPDIRTNDNVNAGWTGLRNRILMEFRDTKVDTVVLDDKLDDYLRGHKEFTLDDLCLVPPLPEDNLNMSLEDLIRYFKLKPQESARGRKSLYNNVATVSTLIEKHPRWQGLFRFNQDTETVEVFGQPFDEENHLVHICSELNTKLHLPHTGIRMVRDCLVAVAHRNKYSPITQEIRDAGQWDGKRRICDMFGTGRNPAEQTVAEAFVYGYVKRVLDPGCFWRNMIILVGPQGVGKTGMARWLAGPHGIVTKISPGDLYNVTKDTRIAILRSHVALFDDIDTLGRADQSQLKSLITMTDDWIRSPYARTQQKILRHGIMMGNSNTGAIIPSDTTGQTRYAVMKMYEEQNWQWLEDNRPQILAEAHHMVLHNLEPIIDYKKMDEHVEVGELEEACEDFAELVLTGDAMVKGGLIYHTSGRIFFKSELFWTWYKKQIYRPKDWEKKELTARLKKLGFAHHTNNIVRISGKNLKHVFEVPQG
jgi:hypothetical protein